MATDDDKLRAWANSRDNPLLFVTDCLGATPLPHQEEALRLIGSGADHIAIRSGHDQGKTTLEAWVALWFPMTHLPCKVVIAANSADQLRDVIHPEIVRWSRNLPPQLRDMYEFGLERIYLKAAPDECFITLRTASKSTPEALAGFHSENLLFLIEEASGIEDVVFEIASGALSSKGSKIFMVGNPTRSQGYFARAFGQNRWRWKCLHWPWRQTPYNDPKYPENQAKEFGEQSNIYRVRVLGEFPLADDDALIPLQLVEAAINREVDVIESSQIVWGLDVGAGGDDSALVKRRGNHIIEKAQAWNYPDPNRTTGRVAREFFETPIDKRPASVNIDCIGVGASVAGRLRELGIPAYGVNVGETGVLMYPERFVRQRDELWWLTREWFEARNCRMLDDPELVGELVAPTYQEQSNGKILVESKKDMKARGVKSPNRADALCLTFAGGEFAGLNTRAAYADDGGAHPFDAIDGLTRRYRSDLPAFASNE